MSDEQNLIKEVDEEVRQDNYKRIWNKYKKHIFILIIILITLVVSINVYKLNKQKKIEKQSELFFQAAQYIELEDYQNAKRILKEINYSQTTGYSDLSFLYLIDLVNKKKISLDLATFTLPYLTCSSAFIKPSDELTNCTSFIPLQGLILGDLGSKIEMTDTPEQYASSDAEVMLLVKATSYLLNKFGRKSKVMFILSAG